MPPSGGYFYTMLEYEILENENSIVIMSSDESFEDFSIELHKFWNWVVNHELNAYCIDYYDSNESDRHGQKVGYHNRDEYLDGSYKAIKSHLTDYLKNLKKIK